MWRRMLPIRKHREERENGIASAVPFSHFSIDAVTFDICSTVFASIRPAA